LQFSCPQSARWRHIASSPFALRPGLSHEDVARTKEIAKRETKERAKESVPTILLHVCGCHEGGRG